MAARLRDEALHDRQAEPRAAPARLRGEEGLEGLGSDLGPHPAAVVRDLPLDELAVEAAGARVVAAEGDRARGDGEQATLRHGLARVHREAQEELFEVGRRHPDGGGLGVHGEAEGHGLAEGGLEQRAELLEDLPGGRLAPAALVVATEDRELAGEVGGAERGGVDATEELGGLRQVVRLGPEQVDRATDDGEDVVEVVRDAAGDAAERLEALNPPDLFLQPQLLGQVDRVDHEAGDAAVAAAEGCGPAVHEAVAAVLGEHAEAHGGEVVDAGAVVHEARFEEGEVLVRDDLGEGHARERLGGAPEHAGQEAVHRADGAVGLEEADTDGGVLEGALEALVACAPGLLGVAERGHVEEHGEVERHALADDRGGGALDLHVRAVPVPEAAATHALPRPRGQPAASGLFLAGGGGIDQEVLEAAPDEVGGELAEHARGGLVDLEHAEVAIEDGDAAADGLEEGAEAVLRVAQVGVDPDAVGVPAAYRRDAAVGQAEREHGQVTEEGAVDLGDPEIDHAAALGEAGIDVRAAAPQRAGQHVRDPAADERAPVHPAAVSAGLVDVEEAEARGIPRDVEPPHEHAEGQGVREATDPGGEGDGAVGVERDPAGAVGAGEAARAPAGVLKREGEVEGGEGAEHLLGGEPDQGLHGVPKQERGRRRACQDRPPGRDMDQCIVGRVQAVASRGANRP